jgi:hypothetical protein
MEIKINFVLFERTFKVIYENPLGYNFFVSCLVFETFMQISKIAKFGCELL